MSKKKQKQKTNQFYSFFICILVNTNCTKKEIHNILSSYFIGGINNDLRPKAWKYLFGFYPPLLSKKFTTNYLLNDIYSYFVYYLQ